MTFPSLSVPLHSNPFLSIPIQLPFTTLIALLLFSFAAGMLFTALGFLYDNRRSSK